MARSSTVFSKEDRPAFGSFLRWALQLCDQDRDWLAEEFHRGAGTHDERRPADLDSYLNGERIPDFENLKRLGRILAVPPGSMYLAGGYLDVIFGCLAAAADVAEKMNRWAWPQSPREAALERLFSLFPIQSMDPALNEATALFHIIEKMGRIGLPRDQNFYHRLWPFWAWMMPDVVTRPYMVRRESRKLFLDPTVAPHIEGEREVYRAVRAQRDISFADATSTDLFSEFEPSSPNDKSAVLFAAIAPLKDRRLSWPVRTGLASTYVHQWAESVDSRLSQDIRLRMRASEEREIDEQEEESYLGLISLAEGDTQGRLP